MFKEKLQYLFIVLFLVVLVGSVVLAGYYLLRGVNVDLGFFNRTAKQYLGLDLVPPANYIYPQKKQAVVAPTPTPPAPVEGVFAYQLYNIPGDYTVEKAGAGARSPFSAPVSSEIVSLNLPAIAYNVALTASSEQISTGVSQYQFSSSTSKRGKLIFICNHNCPNPKEIFKGDVLIVQGRDKRYYYKVETTSGFEQTDLADVEANLKEDEILLLLVVDSSITKVAGRRI